jgi:hypothetical protein
MDDEEKSAVNYTRTSLFGWLTRKQQYPIPKERGISKEYQAGFFSLLTFSWMSSLMAVGN